MINKIVNKYKELGVQFWIENNQLRFRAPIGVLNEELKSELRLYKVSLFNYYNDMDKSELISDLSNKYELFPLTDIQSAYLLGRNDNYEYGGVGCHAYFELTMPKLDKERLEKAWHCVINRHDMLRAVVLPSGYQQVLSSITLPKIQFQDLKNMPQNEVDKKIKKVRKIFSTKQYETDKWPLYDIYLTNTDENSILHFSIDMLISDFVSTSTILADLDYFYYEPENTLSELKVTFRDLLLYKQKQEEHPLQQEKRKQDSKYWMDRIDTIPESPQLPVIMQNKVIDKVTFNQHKFFIEKKEWDFICKYSKQQKITPSCALLAAYAEVIGRWSKESNFSIDITILNRPNLHLQINDVVGDFTSVDILEVSPKKDSNFKDRAKKLQERLWLDLDHSSFSGIEVLREMNRRHNKNIIIPVVYTSTVGLGDSKNINGEFMRNAKLTYKISQTPQVWIDCQVSEQNGGVLVNWDVRDGIFPKGMIEDAFQSFENLIRKMGMEENIWLEKRPLELPNHVKSIRNSVNNTDGPIKEGLLQDGFCNSVKNYPDNIALYSKDKYFTYKELAEYAITVQKELLSRGCKKGDFVAIILDKGVWQIASVLGTLLAGGVYLPIDLSQPSARQNHILKDSKTKYLLTNKTFSNNQDISVINVEELNLIKNEEIKNVDVESDKVAYIIHTSGTTGKPKGVVISHKSALNTILDINERFNVSSNDKILGLANLAFDLSVYDIFGILSVGGTLVLPDPKKQKNPNHWCELSLVHNITLWNSVPAQMEMFLSCLQSREDSKESALRLVLLSGDWIPITLPKLINENCPKAKTISLGGATEGSIWSIIYPIENVPENAVSIPYGTPLYNQKFYVLNKSLEPCPNWTIGDLYIGGIGLALGYLGNEKLTSEKFITHPVTKERLYYTGDIGRYYPDGNIEFLGREDTQVKINGHRIELSEIESVLQNYEGISKAVVMVSENNLKEHSLVAFAEPRRLKTPNTYLKENNKIYKLCIEKGKNITSNIDSSLFSKWVELADKTVLLDIMKAFRRLGLFYDMNCCHNIEEIQVKTKALPKYHNVIKRWLNALTSKNMLEKLNKGYGIKDISLINDKTYSNYWNKFKEIEQKLNYSNKLVSFLENSGKYILDILEGKVEPSKLLFPEGSLDIGLAAYNDNLINSSINKIIIEGVLNLVDEYTKSNFNRPIRILELGAGVGGTSIDLIPALDTLNVEYHFTDISEFFLNEAKIKFNKYPWVSYGLFDINKDYWTQGLTANSWDIIICGNVLHNSLNVSNILSDLKELTVQGGALIVIEATRELKALLTSMAFQYSLDGITDFRKNTDGKIFLNYKEWKELFNDVKGEVICSYPQEDDTLSLAGQSVFITRFIAENENVFSEDIKSYIQSQLPGYMVPNYIEIMPNLPLSSNGKVDRKTLKERIFKNITETVTTLGEELQGDLETRIGDIWRELLNREKIWRNESFYDAGGDSLLVAKVVAKMKENLKEAKEIEWDRLLIEMLRTPTIAGISDTLKKSKVNISNLKEDKDSKTPFVILAQGIEKDKSMKVFFTGGLGNLTQFNNLIPPIINRGNRRETIGAFDLSKAKTYSNSVPCEKLFTTLGEECAEILLKEDISKVQLIGYCSGGFVAIETARILLESGIDIEEVITIDANPCDVKVEYELLLERMFGLLIGGNLLKAGHIIHDDLLKSGIKKLKTLSGRKITRENLFSLGEEYEDILNCYRELEKIPKEERIERLVSTASTITDNELKNIDYLYNVFKQNNKGVANYKPDIFTGDVHGFICKHSEGGFFPKADLKGEDFLREIVIGDLDITYIKGNHLTCIQSPNGNELANLIIKQLNL